MAKGGTSPRLDGSSVASDPAMAKPQVAAAAEVVAHGGAAATTGRSGVPAAERARLLYDLGDGVPCVARDSPGDDGTTDERAGAAIQRVPVQEGPS